MMFTNKIVSNIKNINEKEIEFEHDSSEEAWEHYKRIYFDNKGNSKINDIYNFIHEYQLVLCSYRDGKYYDEPIYGRKNRYHFLSKNASYNKITKEYSGEKENLSGECDFNFNHFKSKVFKRILEYEQEGSREQWLTRLEECKKMHHTLLNFSLMQTKGNMQGFKGNCFDGERETMLDRLDTFIFYLSEYYRTDDSRKDSTLILKNASSNKIILKGYLNSFIDIYDYCNKIYLLDEKKFVDRIIYEGKLQIKTPDDVKRYMLLALDFWDKKEQNIKKIYDNLK